MKGRIEIDRHPAYIDHKLIKTDNHTYAEYSKKGIFLKNVPSDLPLLVKNPK
jgi:hypothetical protein